MEKQESRTRCCISEDRLKQLQKIVNTAVLEHKIFIVRGHNETVRNALLDRGWLEKIDVCKLKLSLDDKRSHTTIDGISANLPSKQNWESPTSYKTRCEKIIMSRLLQSEDINFYWSVNKDEWQRWQSGLDKKIIVNRFCRSHFTSKEGLCHLLKMYWNKITGVSDVRFPRCYTSYSAFVEDYRMTACISLLKWLVQKINSNKKGWELQICTPDGKVPISSITFAIDRCNDYINLQKQIDIDKKLKRTKKYWDLEWEQFITNFQLLIYKNQLLAENEAFAIYTLYKLENPAREALKNIKPYWPQIELDGIHNIWIMKPGNKCRGIDVKLVKDASEVLQIMNDKLYIIYDNKYVVQKYIECPLLICNTKFDIRQWFLVTCVQPLTVWMYKDCYLRFSTRKFNLIDFHEAIHLTNNSIQSKYKVSKERHKALPKDNMWDSHTFKDYLTKIGQEEKWDKIIYPGMKKNIIGVMLASQFTMDRRPNTFELYGADFMIAEDFTPWLLEINGAPDMAPTTSVTARMCPQCCEDVIKVVIDHRKDPEAATGLFEQVYPQKLSQ